MAGRVERGDIWLCDFEPPDKRRPVVVVSRADALLFLRTAMVAPITSTIHGVRSEVILDVQDGMKNRCAINLDHIQLVEKSQLRQRVARLSGRRLADVCQAVAFATGCD